MPSAVSQVNMDWISRGSLSTEVTIATIAQMRTNVADGVGEVLMTAPSC